MGVKELKGWDSLIVWKVFIKLANLTQHPMNVGSTKIQFNAISNAILVYLVHEYTSREIENRNSMLYQRRRFPN